MKRVILVFALAVAALLLFSACSSQGQNSGQTAESAASKNRDYTIKIIVPDHLVMVKTNTCKADCSNVLLEGLRNLSDSYNIIETPAPINMHLGWEGITGALLVMIEPKR